MRLKSTLLFIFMLIIHELAIAQFTYVGVNTGYNNLPFDRGLLSGESSDNTAINDLTLYLNAMHRPFRNIGFGVELGIPLVKGFKWSFAGSETNSGGPLDFGDFEIFDSWYTPENFNYNIFNKRSITLYSRFILNIENNLYIDLRYTSYLFEESFIFKRNLVINRPVGPNLAPIDIEQVENVSAAGPGIGIGYMPHLSDRIYAGYEFNIDFLKRKGNGFSHSIPFRDSNGVTSDEVILESKIEGSFISYQFNLHIGYYF